MANITDEELRERQATLEFLRQYNEALAKGKESMDWQDSLKEKMVSFGVPVSKAGTLVKGFGAAASVATEHLTAAVAKFVSAADKSFQSAYKGTQRVDAYNDALTDLTDSTNSLIKAVGYGVSTLLMFVPGGQIFGGLLAFGTFMVTKTRELDNRMNNAARTMAAELYDAQAKMVESGAMGAQGMMGLRDTAKELGLGMEQLNGFVSEVTGSAQDFAKLTGNVGRTTKFMGEMGKEIEGNQEALRRMGIPLEAVPKAMASYLRVMSKTGQVLEQDSKKQSAAFMEYTMQVDRLAQMTGKKREEIESEYEAQLQEESYNAALLAKETKARALADQGRGKEAEAILEGVKRTKDFGVLLGSLGLKELAEAQNAATTGTLNNAKSQQYAMAVQGALGESLESLGKKVERGELSKEEAADRLVKATAKFASEYGAMARQYGAEIGPSTKELRTSVQLSANGIEKAAQEAEANRKKREAGVTAADKANAESLEAQRKASIKLQDFIADKIPEAAKAMTKLTSAVNFVADEIERRFGVKLGGEAKTATPEDVKQAEASAGSAFALESEARKTRDEQLQKVNALRQKVAQGDSSLAEELKKQEKKLAEDNKQLDDLQKIAQAKAAEAQRSAQNQKALIVEQEALEKKIAKANRDAERWKELGNKEKEKEARDRAASMQKQSQSLATQIEATKGAPGAAEAASKLGGMAARFESGAEGSAAVGRDSTGGTSYGKYQIASKTGTMAAFMQYLKTTNPEAYARLSAAGPADAGKDGAFAQEWKKLAGEGKLAGSEHEFIKKTHYDVGAAGLKDKNLQDMLSKSKALQEVLWSTSVQHGGAGSAEIFNKVFKEGTTEQDLIKAIYAERGTKFGSSTAQERASVQNRFAQEQQLALGMVGQPGTAAPAAQTAVTTQAPATQAQAPAKATQTAAPAKTTMLEQAMSPWPTGYVPFSKTATAKAEPASAKATQTAAVPAQQKLSQKDLAEMGLKLASKDVQAEGASVSPALLTLAQKVQSELSEFNGFTGLNDQFHNEKAPSSQHTKGLAMDFVVSKPPTRDEGQKISDMLKAWGANFVIDEYNNPSSKATGGHFHAQVSAADGAVLSGPQSGYKPDLTMHGAEAIIPLKNESVPVQITADSTIGQTLVSLNSLMEQLLEHAQGHGDLLQRIADSSKNTASATEKSARYAQN